MATEVAPMSSPLISDSGSARESVSTAGTLRILLVDDHALVRCGLAALINAQPGLQVVGEASDGQEACRLAGELVPDIIVMDVSMPGWNGAQATAKIKQYLPQVKVLALTMHEDKSYLRSLLEAGVSGYVLKRSASEDLIGAIHTVAQGGTFLDPHLSPQIVAAITRDSNGGGRLALRGGMGGTALSERETEVLKLIAQGYTNHEVGERLFLSVKTIETYKARGMEKLELDGRAGIVRYALAQGWLNAGD
jgi:DNA-binding NarL/FixJ family response regulator